MNIPDCNCWEYYQDTIANDIVDIYTAKIDRVTEWDLFWDFCPYCGKKAKDV